MLSSGWDRSIDGKLCIVNTGYSPDQVATHLGVSRGRVLRALADPRHESGARTVLTRVQVEQLVRKLGVHPTIAGLSRSEALVMAVLARRPRGMASRHEVARASSLSPATASKVIGALIADGLVTETPTVLALGTARTVGLLRVAPTHPRWSELLPQLAGVIPPVLSRGSDRLPDRLRHAFWNVPPATYRTLTATQDGAFIAARALSTMDLELLGWAAGSVPADGWRTAGRARGLSKQKVRMALNFAEAPRG